MILEALGYCEKRHRTEKKDASVSHARRLVGHHALAGRERLVDLEVSADVVSGAGSGYAPVVPLIGPLNQSVRRRLDSSNFGHPLRHPCSRANVPATVRRALTLTASRGRAMPGWRVRAPHDGLRASPAAGFRRRAD